jgi:hypothetical protein
VPAGRHSTKDCKRFFAECHPAGTRQRTLCRVPAIWHSGKNILIFLKNLCRVPDHGHSAKKVNKRLSFFLSLLSLHSLSLLRRRAARSPPRLPAPPPPRARPLAAPPPRRAPSSLPMPGPPRVGPSPRPCLPTTRTPPLMPPRPRTPPHAAAPPRPPSPSAPTPPRLHAGIIFVALYNFCDIVFPHICSFVSIYVLVLSKLLCAQNICP